MRDVWLELLLTLPLVIVLLAACWLISRSLHELPSPSSSSDDDGGIRRSGDRLDPLRPFPRFPRRGPHGDPPPLSPRRVRSVTVRARALSNRSVRT